MWNRACFLAYGVRSVSPRRIGSTLVLGLLLTVWASIASAATSVLFVGNSFTYAAGSPVRFYRANTVTDLNDQGIGGVPALFKAFATQRGLEFDVYLETQGGVGLDWHFANKQKQLGLKPWDRVVMHGYSTLDAKHPGDPTLLVQSTQQMADWLHQGNPKIDIYLMATWSRADQTYEPQGHWYGKPISAMQRDVRAAYDLAAKASPYVRAVVPVGEAFDRAIVAGVADPNPYDGIEFGKVDLWTYDHYHASTYGYYLEALVVFGYLTGVDPLALGDAERCADELGLSKAQTHALQQVAHDQLLASGVKLGSAPQ